MIQFGLDITRGTIIGEYSVRVALVAPNGKIQREAWIGANDCPKAWACAQKHDLLSRPCGDGKPLSFHQNVVEMIYGTGEWGVRLFDDSNHAALRS